MARDAHDDPYRVGRRPFVLTCADCGDPGRVRALRRAEEGTDDTPLVPLCEDCAGIETRVWGTDRLALIATPPTTDTVELVEGGTLYVVLCPRCDGTGTVAPYGRCFACLGWRYVLLDPKGVRRTARWWQTYQQNRTGSDRGGPTG